MGFLDKIGGVLGAALGVIFKPISKLLKKWLLPDVPAKEGLVLPREGSNVSIPIVYGRRKVGGITVDKNVTDGNIDFNVLGFNVNITGGNKNALLHLLVIFSHGEVEAIDEIQFNGKPSSDPQFAKKNGNKWFAIQTRLGGSDNNTAVDGVGLLNNFDTVNSKYEGLCFALITLEQDKDQTVWRGIPEITAIIRGKKCFDWRTNQTVYTENPAVHEVDYLKSTIYGKGLNDADLNYDYFTDVANSCDVIESTNSVTTTRSYYEPELGQYINLPPTVTTESFKRFTNNTIIDTERSLFDNMQEIANAFRGYFPEPDGRIAIGSEDTATSVFSFDTNNIIGKITRSTTSRNDRYNRVIVKFPNKLNDYETDEVYYPDAASQTYTDWLTEDNGVPLETTINADHCVYKAEALQLAEVAAKVSRNSDQVNFLATLEAAELDIGDVIDVTDENRGWTNVEFRISELSFNDDGTVGIAALLHNNTVYPWAGKDYDERIGGIFLGDPTNIAAPTNLAFAQDPNLSNSGEISWDHVDDAFSRGYRIEIFTIDAEPLLIVEGETTSKRFQLPLINQGVYTISVVAISTIGTISDAATLELQLIAPVAPTDIIFLTNDWDFEIQPAVVGGIGSGSTFQFDYIQGDGVGYTPTSRANGASYTATGLIPNTLYTAYARTVNAFGESVWYSEATTTTQVGAQVQPFLDNIETELDDAQDAIDALGETQTVNFAATTGLIDDINVDIGLINTDITTIENDITTIDANIELIDAQAQRDRFELRTVFENTEEADLELLRGLTNDAASREVLRQQSGEQQVLIDASVFVDPNTGQIINKAFSYSDGLFTQAELRIDGVEGEITAAVDRIETTETGITGLSAELALVPAQITATATAIVSESIAALEPAFVFNFFDSAQGWVAVNGTVTSQTNQIAVTWGDIENASLGYDADNNKLIRVAIERTGGSGWVGNVVIERDNATTETFAGIITEPPASGSSILLIDFSGLANYSGVIDRVRLTLGASVADTFVVSSITVGKADATTQDLQNITARVTQAELDIDANEGAITQRVTVTDYNNDTVTFSNVETTVDGLNSIISLEATRQSLIDNDTIANANTALIEIDALDGTVTTLAETVTANQETNETTFTQVSNELDSVNGRITNNTFGIITDGGDAELESLTSLFAELDIATIRKSELDRNFIFADAIQQLNVDIGETGAIAESILNLTAAINSTDVQVVAVADRVTQAEVDIDGNASALDQTNLSVTDLSTNLSAAIDRIDLVELDVDGNATAISTVEGQVNNPETNASVLYGFVQQAQADADGANTVNTVLSGQINDPINNASALYGFVQQAQTDADGNATSITNLTNRVSNTETGITAAVLRIDAVELDADGNANAISTLEGKVDDPTNNTSALYGFVQTAQSTADGAVSSVTALTNRVESNEDFADAQLILNTAYDSDLDTLTARAFLGVDINNRVTGINIAGEPDETVIDFIGDKIRFIRPNDLTAAFEWDDVNDTFVFDGKIIATDSTFTGTVTASSISGGTVTGGAISGGTIDGTTITGTTIIGGVFQAIGANFMRIISGDAFGVNNLLEWYGEKNATTFDVGTGQAILAGLTKVNGIEWKDDQGIAFTSGTIIAGTLTVSKQSSELTQTPSIETGAFGSNGGQIAINCSGFASFGLTENGDTCGIGEPNPQIVIRLYDISSGSNVLVNQQTFTGSISCFYDLENDESRKSYNVNGSFTFFDNGLNTSNRNYRVEATISNMDLFPLNNRNQRLSILTQEA